MGHDFDSDLTDGRAFDRAWLRAHAISHCRIEMPWSWRLEKAFPAALMVFGVIAVTATLFYSLSGRSTLQATGLMRHHPGITAQK